MRVVYNRHCAAVAAQLAAGWPRGVRWLVGRLAAGRAWCLGWRLAGQAWSCGAWLKSNPFVRQDFFMEGLRTLVEEAQTIQYIETFVCIIPGIVG